jgi:hypothetical protein
MALAHPVTRGRRRLRRAAKLGRIAAVRIVTVIPSDAQMGRCTYFDASIFRPTKTRMPPSP